MELFFATRNKDKLREVGFFFRCWPIRIISPVDIPVPEILEDGISYEENALKKARISSQIVKKITIAEDSGIEVDYLKGRPGLSSSHYAGPGATAEDNNKKLLEELKDVPIEKRGAVYRCVFAIVSPEGLCDTVEGNFRGYIASEPKGENGFGYDPIMVIPEEGITFAQLDLEGKNAISHRGVALRKLAKLLPKYFPQIGT